MSTLQWITEACSCKCVSAKKLLTLNHLSVCVWARAVQITINR